MSPFLTMNACRVLPDVQQFSTSQEGQGSGCIPLAQIREFPQRCDPLSCLTEFTLSLWQLSYGRPFRPMSNG